MSKKIHSSAIVDAGAQLGDDVEIGPFCIVGPKVRLGDGCRLMSHVVIDGETVAGRNNLFFPGAAIGLVSQDIKSLKDPVGRLVIGDNNTFRENTTMHPGTTKSRGETTIGNDNFFLVNSHVGHDCQIGNNITLSNNSCIAGHCVLEDRVIVGGNSAVHQFCRLGEGSMIGGLSGIKDDLIPFGMVFGVSELIGLNLVGLKRRGYEADTINPLLQAYKQLFGREGTLKERVQKVKESYPDNVLVQKIIAFMEAGQDRGFCQPSAAGRE
ncbi:MAG: acyl-ACP--UDP-N-acetylglucosamine O-acyltransferase [Alphaproteobacteria bacterium]|nr:acyl-ACP--UDP-N-acetylglucosamine O-acyltransferase [Alphaproteobacteria bacterium]